MATQTQKNSEFRITAKHQAFGTVTVILEATDRKHAFSQFKSMVFNHRQWIISSNEAQEGEGRAPMEVESTNDLEVEFTDDD